MTKYSVVLSSAWLLIFAYNTSALTLPEDLNRVRRQTGSKACQCSQTAAGGDVVSDVQPQESLGVPSVNGPTQPCVQSAQPADDPPKLFEPEVDLLSSVLGTLHKVSDQNFKEAATKEITEETNRLREAMAFKDGLLKATSKLTREHPELPALPKVLDKLGSLKYREDDYVPDISRSANIASALRGSSDSSADVMDSEPSASEDAPVISRVKPDLAALRSSLARKRLLKHKSGAEDQDEAASDNSPTVKNSKALKQILSNDQESSHDNRLNKIKNFLSSKNRDKSSAESDTLQSMNPEMADQISAAIRKTLSGTTSAFRCRIIFE